LGKSTSWEREENILTLEELLTTFPHSPEYISTVEVLPHLIIWEDPVELQRIDHVDLEYPIVVFMNNSQVHCVVDGHHRIHKAIKLNMETIRAILIDINDLPDKMKYIFDIQ
jgi:hypothetical protein